MVMTAGASGFVTVAAVASVDSGGVVCGRPIETSFAAVGASTVDSVPSPTVATVGRTPAWTVTPVFPAPIGADGIIALVIESGGMIDDPVFVKALDSVGMAPYYMAGDDYMQWARRAADDERRAVERLGLKP